jgi:hypothetical protein
MEFFLSHVFGFQSILDNIQLGAISLYYQILNAIGMSKKKKPNLN